jgi:capsular polysaccharide biosynthesis protein
MTQAHALPFDPTDDPALLIQPGPPRIFTLLAAARSPPPGPLWAAGAANPRLQAEHESRAVVPPGSIHAVPGHRIGGDGLLLRDGSMFWQDGVLPGHLRDAPPAGTEAPQVLPCPIPLALATHGPATWGRVLLETLPKLWLLAQLRRLGVVFRLAVSRRRPAWVDAVIQLYFAPDELVWYDPDTQVLEPPVVLVPSLLSDAGLHLHPAMNLVAEDLVARALAGGTPPAPEGARLFLSRARLPGNAGLANTEQVEREMAGLGFTVLHPQTLALRDQVAALSHAACIAGPYGAALHGALFMPRGSQVICLDRADAVQDRIAALRGQLLGVVQPRREAGHQARIDPELLRRFVPAFLRGEVPAAESRLRIGGWLAHAPGLLAAERHVLSPPARVERTAFLHAEPIDPAQAPFGTLFGDLEFAAYDTPELAAVCLQQAVVLAPDGLVLAGGAVLRDTLPDAAGQPHSAVAAVEAESVVLKRAAGQAGPAGRPCFLGFTGGWRDYAAWLLQCLPRLLAFERLRAQVPELALVLPALPPGSFQMRTLELLGIPPAGVLMLADDTALPCAPLWTIGDIDPWRPPMLVREAAERLSQAVPDSVAEHEGNMPLRLYLHRTVPRRRMTGFAELQPMLRAGGFHVVADPPALDEQVRLLRNARAVVGEHGAALAGIMFARPGCRVLELFNTAGARPTYWSLASLCGLRYGFAVGRSDTQTDVPPGDAAYVIAPEQLARALAALRT